MPLIIFPERTREQIHINGYATYLYNTGSGHIPQVADQQYAAFQKQSELPER